MFPVMITPQTILPSQGYPLMQPNPPMVAPSAGDGNTKYAKIQDGLENSLSFEGKTRISRILGDIRQLTDVEKLLLYLKLPSGAVQEDQTRLTPPSCLPSSSRREQGEAATWIRSHLEGHGDVCMPKAEVYDEYRQYCDQHDLRPLCNADFGKMMKQVFPEINTRRLGQRGQSKYFYGGLRKKVDHAQPTLPGLEIHSKNMEIDSNVMNSELFRASCQLVCEWADKLLDTRFGSVQAVAEHLVTNLYVNTKSGEAFTLIAAMQERGSDNLKGSALFASQMATCGDKHKETNMLLQQKLHKNKLLQKQKEKLQAMKEEVEQQKASAAPAESRTPSIPSRKSTTPSRSAKTPKLPSPSPSPVPMQSPLKIPSIPEAASSCMTASSHSISVSWSAPISSSSASSTVSVVNQGLTCEAVGVSTVEKHDISNHDVQLVKPADTTARMVSDSIQHIPASDGENITVAESEGSSEMIVDSNRTNAVDCESKFASNGKGEEVKNTAKTLGNSNEEVVFVKFEQMDQTSYGVGVEVVADGSSLVTETNVHIGNTSETPYSEMDTDQISTNHVRKIDFDNMVEKKSDIEHEQNMVTIQQGDHGAVGSEANHAKMPLKESSSTKLQTFSKSAGHSGLKQLLQGKDQASLNKSHGSLEISKNTLFVNQSKIQGGSAFVPFSKVPCRKDIASGNPPTNAIPIFIPSTLATNPQKQADIFTFEAVSQPANIAMIAVPNSLATPHLDLGPTHQRLPDNIIKIMPSASTVHMSTASTCSVTSRESVSSQASESVISVNLKTIAKETSTPATPSTAVSMISSCESITSASSSVQISPNVPKHMKTRFTPIRPKSSPNKAAPVREAPVYDKRPVSAILKEKRAAKEQAEAAAGKLQANLKLPTIPFQPHVLSHGSLASVQGVTSIHSSVTSNIPAKEVVIIVNSQTGAGVPSLVNPTKLIAQPLGAADQIAESSAEQKADQGAIQDMLLGKSLPSKQHSKQITDAVKSADTSREAEKFTHISELMEVSESNVKVASHVSTKPDSSSHMETSKDASNGDQMVVDMAGAEEAWSETPVKIAKLNITSPNRPDSACSLGRETPIKIAKMSDSCLSRPESACSYGRETPSGARKRKSSDLQPKRNFKRLNSTGEDGDEAASSRALTDVLSPGIDVQVLESRQTRSCTLEIDKDSKLSHPQKVQRTLPVGLQKPDISSLEREALIESFPNSMLMMKPHKLHKQTSSVGVNAKSLRASQQSFIKQQQVLDQRVKNFFKESYSDSSIQNPAPNNPKHPGKLKEQRPEQKNNGAMRDSASSKLHTSNVRFEPSGLPTDVADWINETILKRQQENQSALSEPDLGVLNQRPASVSDVVVPNFNFQIDGGSLSRKDPPKSDTSSVGMEDSCKQNASTVPGSPASSQEKVQPSNPFTVPRVPAVTVRAKDHGSRVSLDLPMNSQRCQSLPTFTSPVQSPLSPVTSCRTGMYQRATSMSPRGQQYIDGHVDMLSPVGTIVSPMRNIDVRDNLPMTVNGSTVTGKMRDDVTVKHGANQIGSYMASLQHNLQKPREPLVEQPSNKTVREQSVDKFGMPSAAIVGSSACTRTAFNRDFSNESLVGKTSDRLGSQTISDSGYHSTGPSPVLNSTPVSNANEFDTSHTLQKLPISQSPVIIPSEYTSPIHCMSPQESPIQMSTIGPPQNSFGSRMRLDSGIQLSPLNTSTNSAFVPIQGSPNDIRYVTPIRPTVTLPNSGNSVIGNPGFSSTTFIDPNQSSTSSEDVVMVSPKSSQDPPSYEMTMKMRSASLNIELGNPNAYINILGDNQDVCAVTDAEKSNISNRLTDTSSMYQNFESEKKKNASHPNERVSLLANMGKTAETPQRSKDQFGPFASKLVQLSQQTKLSPKANPGGKPNTFRLSSIHDESFQNANTSSVSPLKSSVSAPVLSSFTQDGSSNVSFISSDNPSFNGAQQINNRYPSSSNSQLGAGTAMSNEIVQPETSNGANSLLANDQSGLNILNIQNEGRHFGDASNKSIGEQVMQASDMNFFENNNAQDSVPSCRDELLMLNDPSNTKIPGSNQMPEVMSTFVPSNISSVSQSFPGSILDDKMSIDFGKATAPAVVEKIDSIFKELERSSTMRSTDTEFPDQLDLAIETLMDGQYFEEGLYASDSVQNQQLGDFAMLED